MIIKKTTTREMVTKETKSNISMYKFNEVSWEKYYTLNQLNTPLTKYLNSTFKLCLKQALLQRKDNEDLDAKEPFTITTCFKMGSELSSLKYLKFRVNEVIHKLKEELQINDWQTDCISLSPELYCWSIRLKYKPEVIKCVKCGHTYVKGQTCLNCKLNERTMKRKESNK